MESKSINLQENNYTDWLPWLVSLVRPELEDGMNHVLERKMEKVCQITPEIKPATHHYFAGWGPGSDQIHLKSKDHVLYVRQA